MVKLTNKYLRVLVVITFTLVSNIAQSQSLTEIEINEQADTAVYPKATTRLVGLGVDKDVIYDDHGDYGVVEGDIYVPISNSASVASDATIDGVVSDGYRWPEGKIHYRFSNVSALAEGVVRDAISYIEARTSVDFIEISAAADKYHILITDDIKSEGTGRYGCYSNVGYRADIFSNQGFQRLNVQRADGDGGTCLSRGIVIHELMHALGVWHEQSREDRDSYVTILYENIEAGKEGNFDQRIHDATDISSYDYESIMHYGAFAFSSNSLRTIETIQAGVTIGQRGYMTNLDVASIDAIYQPADADEASAFILPPILHFLLDD